MQHEGWEVYLMSLVSLSLCFPLLTLFFYSFDAQTASDSFIEGHFEVTGACVSGLFQKQLVQTTEDGFYHMAQFFFLSSE